MHKLIPLARNLLKLISIVVLFSLPKSLAAAPTSYNLQLVLSHNDNSAKKNIWLVQETKKVTTAETVVPREDENWSEDKAWKFDEASPKELLKEHFDEVEKVSRQIYMRSRIVKGEMNATAVVLAIQYQILRANKIIFSQTTTVMTRFGSPAAIEVGDVRYFKDGSLEEVNAASETMTVTVTPTAL